MKIAVVKFASCDGCQLSLLHCTSSPLNWPGQIEWVLFEELSSARSAGPFDLTIVEGSISVPADVERIRTLRAASTVLVTIGACANGGGVQALRNFGRTAEFLEIVYANPEYIQTLEFSSPVSHFVPVDYELQGCPVSTAQLRELLGSILDGRRPNIPSYSVCAECKARGNTCLVIAQKTPCLGPVTRAGCGALCPSYNRGCYGCYGPAENPNTAALTQLFPRGHAGPDVFYPLQLPSNSGTSRETA